MLLSLEFRTPIVVFFKQKLSAEQLKRNTNRMLLAFVTPPSPVANNTFVLMHRRGLYYILTVGTMFAPVQNNIFTRSDRCNLS